VHGEEHFANRYPVLRESTTKCHSVPLTCANGCLGCFVIGSKQPAAYSQEDLRLLSLGTDMIATALDNAINLLFKAYTRRLEGGDKQASTAVELYAIRRQDLFAVSDLETWVQRTVQLTWRQR
jgi:GAF domain-containing protein